MRKVEEIEQQIQSLSNEEFVELRTWFFEQDWAAWDEQFEDDARSGKLDALGEVARQAHAAGKVTKL